MLGRIKGVLYQEIYITKWSIEVWMDILVFPTTSALVFGLIARYLSGENYIASTYLILGMLFWQVIYISQYSVSVGALWNVWSRNLSNMFISPLTVSEYLLAQIISSAVKGVGLFVVLSLVYFFAFNFNILQVGVLNICLYLLNMMVFAWAMAIVILGVIFRFGTRIQALAWGLIFMFQPLTAAFFPISVLPTPFKEISLLFPPTYIFEAARGNITNPQTDWQLVIIGAVFNTVYLSAGLFIFFLLFKKSKETGQFARNEG
jgi:ABC-2 type transport system permease protein